MLSNNVLQGDEMAKWHFDTRNYVSRNRVERKIESCPRTSNEKKNAGFYFAYKLFPQDNNCRLDNGFPRNPLQFCLLSDSRLTYPVYGL